MAELSPAMLAGMALRAVPVAAVQPLADAATSLFVRRHPSALERLRELRGKSFRIDVSDMPWCFLIRTDGPAPTVKVFANDAPPSADAIVRGSASALFDLAQGRVDGDALFFSRALTIGGDTGAVVELRNILDNEGVNLAEDLAQVMGPLGGVVRAALDCAGAVYQSAERDLQTVQAAAVAPLERKLAVQERELTELRERLARLESKA